MIDGVKCVCGGVTPAMWNTVAPLDFGISVSETTGELLCSKREAKRDGLTFRTNGGCCQLFGSLHTFKNGGGTNADNFTFNDLQRVLNALQTVYKVDLDKTLIQHLEIGVNIPLEYSPEIPIKAAISHRGRSFTPLYDRKRHRVGKVCERLDYTLKLYDKGKQDGTGANILRFEYVAHRGRVLESCGVRTLSDLQSRTACAHLLGLLVSVISDLVFYDFKYKGAGMSAAKWAKFQQYSNPNYWEGLTKFARAKALPRYFEKVAKYGLIDWRKWLFTKTTKQGLVLLGCDLQNGGFSCDSLEDCKQMFLATFSTLECSLEKVATTNGRGNLEREGKPIQETETMQLYHSTTKQRRFCAICGREITHQKGGSRFCSEKYFGKEARKCRNKDSNRRLTLKRKIKRAMKQKKDIAITYESNGQLFTDILHPSEIGLTREWLDRVQKVEILETPPQRLTGKAARKYMKQYELKKQEEKQ